MNAAIENYHKAIEINPDFKEAYIHLGDAVKKTGDVKSAMENYRKAIKIDPRDSEPYINLALLL